MTTLIFGGSGYFGRRMLQTMPEAVSESADIADKASVDAALERHQPRVVINCAGKTGRPNVDWCESHPLETYRSNVTGPLVLLESCLRRDIFLVHFSSGCIYQGDNGGAGFRESDPPNFFGSLYSRSKSYSDQILVEFPVLVLRPRMPFDGSLHERSLFSKLSRYRRILDAPNSLTYVPDFLRIARRLIEDRQTGAFNMVNPGAGSPYTMMQRYRERVTSELSFERMDIAQLRAVTSADRSNCILSTEKLRGLGLEPQPLQEALEEALGEIAQRRGDRATSGDET